MTDVVILFPYHGHAPRDVVLQNYSLAVFMNPGVPVVPLLREGEAFLPGTVDVRDFPSPYADEDPWKSADDITLRWIRGGPTVEADRYIVYEWDVYSTTSVRRFYAPVWDADLACFAPQYIARNPDWFWFCDLPLLPPELASFACGLAPWACVLLSARAASLMAHGPLIPGVISELRAGTLARHAGLKISPMEYAKGMISFREDRIRVTGAAGVYHPVKVAMDPPPPPPRRPRPWIR